MVRSETLTLVLVNLAGIMERADESLLPGVYKEVGAALHADPTRLGSLTLYRSIVQTLCFPLAAYLAVRHNRVHIIALGALLWSAATFLVAFSSTFFQVAVSRGLNGIGLALVIPAIQSLVADTTEDHNRGTAFGWLYFTGNIGAILGNLCSVLIAPTTVMGIPGWRISFHLIGTISIIVGILVRLFAHDPHFLNNNKNHRTTTTTTPVSSFKEMLHDAKSVIRIPTFQILIAQGVSGSFPWSALSFLPMWLELLGFSHDTTAMLMTVFVVGSSIGGLFGGKMGDLVAVHYPNAGRIVMSQISAGSVAPMAAILLLLLPEQRSAGWVYGLVLFVMGLLSSWNAPATNNPIFAEIVPEKQRTSIYALDQSLENILASFAPPIVGILAQGMYDYKPVLMNSKDVEEEVNRRNAISLAKALYTAVGIPIIICILIYSFLYKTYPRDRDRVRMMIMHVLIEDDLDMELVGEDGDGGEDSGKEKDRRKVSLECESGIECDRGGHVLIFDDDDEKRLLSES